MAIVIYKWSLAYHKYINTIWSEKLSLTDQIVRSGKYALSHFATR